MPRPPWRARCPSGASPSPTRLRSPPVRKEQLQAFFAAVERELEKVEFFRPPDKRDTMQINLRNIFTRMQPTQQDVRTLHGIITAISEGRKGPADARAEDPLALHVVIEPVAQPGPGPDE